MMIIHSDNSIELDGNKTGLKVTQAGEGTVVYTPESTITRAQYNEHRMPRNRYSLTHSSPVSGSAGKDQFEADLRELLKSL